MAQDVRLDGSKKAPVAGNWAHDKFAVIRIRTRNKNTVSECWNIFAAFMDLFTSIHHDLPFHVRVGGAVIFVNTLFFKRMAEFFPLGAFSAFEGAVIAGDGMKGPVLIHPGDRSADRDFQGSGGKS